MLESCLFKQVKLVLPEGIFEGDLFIQNGKIANIGPSLSAKAEQIINDKGLCLIPGGIDPHVHFREPGNEHKENLYSGSKAAVSGGITSFFDMPNTAPSTTSIESLETKKAIAAKTSLANYNFYIGASGDNLDDLKNVTRVPGIKIYVGSTTGTLLVDQIDMLRRIFNETKQLIAVHSEDEALVQHNYKVYAGSTNVLDHYKIRSAEAAIKCSKELIALALETNTRLHICHLTTKEEAEFIKQTNRKDLISCEVTAQHLLTYGPDIYDKWGTFAQINPPIRERYHQEGLWTALLDGTIDCMGSDHAPHTIAEKSQVFGKAPSGMPGVETTLPLLLNLVHQKKLSLEQVVRLTSSKVAQLFNIKNKGQLSKGYDADLVLVDLNKSRQITKQNTVSKCGWSIFEGQTVTGLPIATFVNGQLVYREGDFFEKFKGKEVEFN
jgi:dihydroorotase